MRDHFGLEIVVLVTSGIKRRKERKRWRFIINVCIIFLRFWEW